MPLLDKADKLNSVLKYGVIPVSAGLSYGALYMVYSMFYSRFHVQPPEVGLGKAEMLNRSWPLLVALTVGLVLSL